MSFLILVIFDFYLLRNNGHIPSHDSSNEDNNDDDSRTSQKLTERPGVSRAVFRSLITTCTGFINF